VTLLSSEQRVLFPLIVKTSAIAFLIRGVQMSTTVPATRLVRAVEVAQQRMPRCCPSHADWPTMRDHLSQQFPTVHVIHVDDEIDRAREATVMFGLAAEEQLPTAEIVVRHNLMLLTGQLVEKSRLDPETHTRNRGQT
jgi:hypothetical protein